MTLVNITAAILIFHYRSANFEDAEQRIINAFKNEFPDSSLSQWNANVSASHAKSILKIYENESDITVNKLVKDLPNVIEALKKSDSSKTIL